MVQSSSKLQYLKRFFAAGSLIVSLNGLNSFTNLANAQVNEMESDSANTPKREIFHYARKILDLEKEAGFKVLPFHYKNLDSIINNAKKEVNIEDVAEELKKEQALNNLKNISEIFRAHNFIYFSDPDVLLHKALETKKMNSYNFLVLYFEIAEKAGLPITAKKADDHYFIEYDLDSETFGWELFLGIEQDKKLYPTLEKNKNVTPLDKEKFLGIADRTIGIHLYKQEKCEEAMKYITKAMNADITDPRTNKYEGDVYKCLGKDERALDSYNYAIEFEENFFEARATLGEMLYKRGELSKALEDYNKSIELSPSNPELYKTKGDILIKLLDKKKEAQKDYEKALELILKK